MRTVGVDLAAEPKKTGIAILDWAGGRAVVSALRVGATDDAIAGAAEGAAKIGIDAPFGWPEPFVEFVTAHRYAQPIAAHDLAGRRLLAYRETDLVVMAETGLRPLSVAADLIGHAAMRAAGLLAALGADGHDIARDGSGLVVESYPAAALKRWGMPHSQYKGVANRASLDAQVDRLTDRMPELELGAAEGAMRTHDDAFDAVLCALIARAVAIGQATAPTEAQATRAASEGWITLVRCDPETLFIDPA